VKRRRWLWGEGGCRRDGGSGRTVSGMFHVKRCRWVAGAAGRPPARGRVGRCIAVGRAFHVKRCGWPGIAAGPARSYSVGRRGRGVAGRRFRSRVSRGVEVGAGVSRETVAVVGGSRRVGRALVGSAAGGQVGRAFHVKWCRCCGLGRVGARALSRVGVRAGRGVLGRSAAGSGSGGRFARTGAASRRAPRRHRARARAGSTAGPWSGWAFHVKRCRWPTRSHSRRLVSPAFHVKRWS
jgi:hypothetical protein